MSSSSPSVIIIGAGIAGLTAGVYAQRNGYSSRIFEMHTQPGGLMTAWKRKGFTIDGCIHWLVGSNPSSSYYAQWEDIGLIQQREIYNPEIFSRYEGLDGKVLNLYTDLKRLKEHLLALAPEDAALIHELLRDIRIFAKFEPPSNSLLGLLKSVPNLLAAMPRMMKLNRMTAKQWSQRFNNPFLREAFSALWMPDMSAVSLPMTLGWLCSQNAGYPIGGSLPMARSVEKRYCDLGGQIHYGERVEAILVEDLPDGKGSKAVGIRLADGREERADVVISAADGYATLYKMLGGRFLSEKLKAMYTEAPIFPPILFIGLGVNREFPDLKGITGGITLPLKKPITIAGEEVRSLGLVIHNFDPTLAPAGKTVITIIQPTSYTYWKDLHEEPERYQAEKERVALDMIDRLDARFSGFAGQVEMADVATPVTFEHYTGNWQGSFEGWQPTPKAMLAQIAKTLPGLENFYMAGQWVQAGGGLPSGLLTGREVVQMLCKKDGKKFR